MYRFLQIHGKKLMAVFSAFLMIAFALPSASKYAGGSDPTVGRIGAGRDKVRASEVYNAKRSWDTLKNIPRRDGQGYFDRELALHDVLLLIVVRLIDVGGFLAIVVVIVFGQIVQRLFRRRWPYPAFEPGSDA